MAHRIITQVIFTGSRIVWRATSEAFKHAQATSRHSQAASKTPGGARTQASAGLTLDEACKILDVPPPKQGQTDMEKVMERFKRLFDANDPKAGGSFYLQSKILRARQRIELESKEAAEQAQKIRDAQGWNPKIYKE